MPCDEQYSKKNWKTIFLNGEIGESGKHIIWLLTIFEKTSQKLKWNYIFVIFLTTDSLNGDGRTVLYVLNNNLFENETVVILLI